MELFLETEVLAVEKTKKGWRVGPVEGRPVVDATGSATVAALAGTSGARLVFHQPERVGTVPLGAMLPKGVGHMLVAGRAVSSDHGANSALRVQASCMGMGQAAGVTTALAARRHCDPWDVPLDMIKKQLTGIGHLVPQQDHRTTQTIHRENRPVHRLKS